MPITPTSVKIETDASWFLSRFRPQERGSYAIRPGAAGCRPQLPRRSAGASGRALFALGLALLTGLTLGQLTLLGGSSFEKPPDRATAAMRTGVEFYEAIDAYLATGQIGELQTLVQPDFVDHTDGQSSTIGFGALLSQLEVLRAFVSGDSSPQRRFPPVAIWCDSRFRFRQERTPRSSDCRSPKLRSPHSATPCALPMAVSPSDGVTSSCRSH